MVLVGKMGFDKKSIEYLYSFRLSRLYSRSQEAQNVSQRYAVAIEISK